MHRPPRLFHKFFRWYCHPNLLAPVEGDLMELYEERLQAAGKKKADWLFIKDVLLLFRKDIIKPTEGSTQLNYYGMLKNYFKVGVRNLLKYKTFSFINIFGLAVAMSVGMLIILMLADQKEYDQFHADKERIYRLLGTPQIGSWPYATIPMPLAESLKEEYPIIEEAVSLRRGVGGDASFDHKTVELKGYFTTNSFFEIFSFPLLKGDKSSALSDPNSIIITKEKAYQLFKTENPIGKQVTFEDRGLHIMDIEPGRAPVKWGTYTVTGVIDLSSYKTHLTFDALVSASTLPKMYQDSLLLDVSKNWEYYWAGYSYVKLQSGISKLKLTNTLNDIAKRNYANSEELREFQFAGQKLTEITPGIPVNNEATFRLPEIAYYVISLLALVILVMAGLNYTNLSVARSLTRMKEIGVRKVNGASRKSLIFQFLVESIITVLIALVLAIGILYFTKEAFMDLWFNKFLNFELRSSFSVSLIFILFAITLGVIAGIYPALFLSKRKPANALKGTTPSKSKWGLQKVLNVSQFAVSMIFMVTSMVIYDQFKYYTTFEYGFNAENIINVPLQSNDYQVMVNEFKGVAGVANVSACDYIPATGITNTLALANDDEKADPFVLLNFNVDEHFIDNLELKLLAGNVGSAHGELGHHIIINESAVEKLGYVDKKEAIGKIWKLENNTSVQIVGVVENFRAALLINGHEIRPMSLRINPEKVNYLNVKIESSSPLKTLAELEQKWKEVDPIHAFRYDFYDNELANTNLAILDVVTIIGYISFLAMLISCLGLLGMAVYAVERKTKEVGIRKVLGATELKLVLVLSKSFLKLLVIAILIAAPLSYLINNLWLDNLPNRIDLGIGKILIGSILLLGLGLLTISSQTIRAALQNPVESLKDE